MWQTDELEVGTTLVALPKCRSQKKPINQNQNRNPDIVRPMASSYLAHWQRCSLPSEQNIEANNRFCWINSSIYRHIAILPWSPLRPRIVTDLFSLLCPIKILYLFHPPHPLWHRHISSKTSSWFRLPLRIRAIPSFETTGNSSATYYHTRKTWELKNTAVKTSNLAIQNCVLVSSVFIAFRVSLI